MADAQVKLTMSPTNYQTLQALLKYHSGKLTDEQLVIILISLGYRAEAYRADNLQRNLPYLYEQMLLALS